MFENGKKYKMILSRRALDRKKSRTPVGDMWHGLNMDRRLEAAEAAIKGITGLVDKIVTDLSDLKKRGTSSRKGGDRSDGSKGADSNHLSPEVSFDFHVLRVCFQQTY